MPRSHRRGMGDDRAQPAHRSPRAGPAGGVSAPLIAPGDPTDVGPGLPEEAFGAALAGLDRMTPRRLWLLVRSAVSLRALWRAILTGEPGDQAALAHLVREAPELLPRWARSAARVDVGAL